MPSSSPPPYDVLCVGEVVIDLISVEPARSLQETTTFRRYLGGAPANVARTVAILGGHSGLVAAVGTDELGAWARTALQRTGVNTDYVIALPHPTTLILITRHTTTPRFLVYRGADRFLDVTHIPDALFHQARAVHTSAFALSASPLRELVFHAMREARKAHRLVSFDPNYHPQLWANPAEAASIIPQAVALAHIVKPSLDDCERLFNIRDPQECARRFLAWGTQHVYVTAGSAGTWWFEANGARSHIPARNIPVVDVTGAGDTFWGGLLMAWLDGLSPYEAAQVGQHLAECKLQQLGLLTSPLDRNTLYVQALQE